MKTIFIKPEKVHPVTQWIIQLLKPLQERWFIAGGAVRCVLDKTPLEDIDLFCTDGESVEDISALLAMNAFSKTFTCPNNKLHTWKHRSGLKLQAIMEVKGTPNEVMNAFDFKCCQLAYYKDQFYAHSPECVKSAIKKHLVVHEISHPHSSIRRMNKYLQKGYYINDLEVYALVMKASIIPFDSELWKRYID